MEEEESLLSALQLQIKRAKEYIGRSVALEEKNIEGANKLIKKIRAELKFLNGVGQLSHFEHVLTPYRLQSYIKYIQHKYRIDPQFTYLN